MLVSSTSKIFKLVQNVYIEFKFLINGGTRILVPCVLIENIKYLEGL